MDAEHLQAIAARDQFWSNLRVLVPEIERLADGHCGETPRDRLLIQLLARAVIAELRFRAEHTEAE
jgi:hypothetical protein